MQSNEHPPRPIPHCYWVVPGQLLAGEYPRNPDEQSSLEKLAKFTEAGVSAFIDLTEAGEFLEPYAICWTARPTGVSPSATWTCPSPQS